MEISFSIEDDKNYSNTDDTDQIKGTISILLKVAMVLLLHSLPLRFRSIVKRCFDSVEEVLSLPMVLLHRDFSKANLIVDKTSCHLVGVLDWGEARIGPFG